MAHGQDRFFRKLENVYQLQELVENIVTGACKSGSRFSLEEDTIGRLHSVAMNRLLDKPGSYRQCPIAISNSPHKPPPWLDVRAHMRSLCEYVNAEWDRSDLVHLSAFVLWRLNWIHPFENGNGRTSRAASYMVMNIKHGKLLPSRNSIIEQIVGNRAPYYATLRAADDAVEAGREVREALMPLESMISEMLKNQIKANLPT